MRWHMANALFWATIWGLLFRIPLGATYSASAQPTQTVPVQPMIFVQPAGATPASTIINAEANYAAACGVFLQYAATARKINAEAVSQEIDNWVKGIKARDEMVDLYWERWRRDHPNYITRQGKLRDVMRKLVEGNDQGLLNADPSVPLNWLFRELSGPMMRYDWDNHKGSGSAAFDLKLEKSDLEMLLLSDGGSKGSRFVAPASGSPNPLEPRWPPALRSDEFQGPRENYEQTVTQMVKEIKGKHEVSDASRDKVMKDVDGLLRKLEEVYPRERRQKSSVEFGNYLAARRFLRAALRTDLRAVAAPKAFVRSGSLQFQGDRLTDLMKHMYQNGLEFAPPEKGDEGVYKKLFAGMRQLYLAYRPNRAGDGGDQNAPPKPGETN